MAIFVRILAPFARGASPLDRPAALVAGAAAVDEPIVFITAAFPTQSGSPSARA